MKKITKTHCFRHEVRVVSLNMTIKGLTVAIATNVSLTNLRPILKRKLLTLKLRCKRLFLNTL